MNFPSLTGNPVYYRTYSRFVNGRREEWVDTIDRVVNGLAELGKLTIAEIELIKSEALGLRMLPAGRSLWCGGTNWAKRPENFSSNYNCSSFRITSFERMACMMDLLMQGVGTGTVLEPDCIDKLPIITTKVDLKIVGVPGDLTSVEDTHVFRKDDKACIVVGDSRQGWVNAFLEVMEAAVYGSDRLILHIELGRIRAAGSKIEGFGGVANPIGLVAMFEAMVRILNSAVGRQLTSVEACLIMDEASMSVVAGGVRRSASMRQFASDDKLAAVAKDNLWVETDGEWSIDPLRDAHRMGNHTRVFHTKPSLVECIESVAKQYNSGEGAIMWAGEAVTRANADLLDTDTSRRVFLAEYNMHGRDCAADYLEDRSGALMPVDELADRLNRYGMNPCAEIIGNNFMCNLADVHLSQFDNPLDLEAQARSFKAASIVVCSHLHHKFVDPIQQNSRELDPIVGVSFTGLFDFFVQAFDVDWLRWWEQGRQSEFEMSDKGWSKCLAIGELFGIDIKKPTTDKEYDDFYHEGNIYRALESAYLAYWKNIVVENVGVYCSKHNLKVPNRCTTVQPSGTKSLLTGSSPGWHPPKAAQFIRRITFSRENPVAMACLDYGYNVIPSVTDKDENGNLLNDPFDPRCAEWLVEVPIETNWAHIEGVESINISKLSALAQFDFYMSIQQNYTTHNTSATIELEHHEIEPLATAIYESIQEDDGYISAALLRRFDAGSSTYPRLPFEPIDRAAYLRLVDDVANRRKSQDFGALLAHYDRGLLTPNPETAGCDSDKCLIIELPQTAA